MEKKKQICICRWLSTNSEESTVKLLEVITELSRVDENTSNTITVHFLSFFCPALSALYSYLILSNPARFTILNFFIDEENEGLRVKYFVHSYTAISLKGTTGTRAIWHTMLIAFLHTSNKWLENII